MSLFDALLPDHPSDMSHVGDSIIQENVLDVEDPHPLQYLNSGALSNFNSQTAGGRLLPGYDATAGGPNGYYSELANAIDDVLVI